MENMHKFQTTIIIFNHLFGYPEDDFGLLMVLDVT